MSPSAEDSRRPGVLYVPTDDGEVLPVVDVTNPAFAVETTAGELDAMVDGMLSARQPFEWLPRFLRAPLFRRAMRGSLLARGIAGAQGSYLRGMDTYLLKLGPDNLPEGASPIDRRIAGAPSVLAVRLRLQDMAQLMAEALAPRLDEAPGRPVRFVNVAGGSAIDSLNALCVLRRDRPASLEGRRVAIDVLDLDAAGPSFGGRALAALTGPGGPLMGLAATLRHVRSDWRDPRPLGRVLAEAAAEGAVAIASSEGGLFEYGSDDDILSNLSRAREAGPPGLAFVGSVTRGDARARRLVAISGAALHPRGIDAFRALAGRAGWEVLRVIARPPSDQVTMVRR